MATTHMDDTPTRITPDGFEAARLKAVLFDMDGVLVDSMPNHSLCWQRAMSSVGLTMQPSEAYTYEGMRGVDTIRMLAKQQWGRDLSEQEARELYAVKSELFSLCTPPKNMPGAEALLRQIYLMGKKIVVVTGSAQRTLLDELQDRFHGLIQPNLMVTSYDVERGKPYPDPYLAGLRKASAKPSEAVVVENAPLGVRAGVAAGIFTIAVNTGPLPDELLLSEGAGMLFHSMEQLSEAWKDLTREENQKILSGESEKVVRRRVIY